MADTEKKPLPIGVVVAGPQPVTIRQRKFVAKLVGGASPKEAAAAIGANPGHAGQIMKQRGVQREIERVLRMEGMDENYAVQRLRELCEASFKTKDGKEVPNYQVRAKGFGFLKDIMGLDAPKKVETTTISFEERLMMVAGEEFDIDEDDALEAEFENLIEHKEGNGDGKDQ